MNFTKQTLRELADGRSYEAGEQYIGAVTDIRPADHRHGLCAVVHGGAPYEVLLYEDRGQLTGECTCPEGQLGEFCKHCVAVGLVQLGRLRPTTATTLPAARAPALSVTAATGGTATVAVAPVHSPAQVRDLLDRRSRDDLADELALVAAADPEVRRRLVEPERPPRPDVAALLRRILQMLRVRSFVDYGGGREYARRITDVVEDLRAVAQDGHHDVVAELAAAVIECTAAAMTVLEDPAGAIPAAASRVTRLHAVACTAARPDAVALADWLLTLQLSHPGLVDLDVHRYLAALGEEGVAAYAGALRTRWERERRGRGGVRLALTTRLMERLAAARRDVDTLVEVLSADLGSGGVYYRIAVALDDAGRAEEALGWAERGLAEVPGPMEEDLADYVARRYAAAGRHADVLSLRWRQFERCAGVAGYSRLRASARAVDPTGGTWASTRARALEHLRTQARAGTRWEWDREQRLTLLDVLLWEADQPDRMPESDPVEEAWRAAHDVGATSRHWVALADRRADRAPDESIAVYHREIEELVSRKRNDGYAQAAELVRRVAALYRETGRPSEATKFVMHLRARYRARRNFVTALDGQGL